MIRLFTQIIDYIYNPSWVKDRKINPISRIFGLERGKPIDRYYIENFLEKYQNDIRGNVLEIGDRGYTEKYGGEKVIRSDVLHATSDNPYATIVGDLSSGNGIPTNYFTCIILTQTLLCIYNLDDAILHTYNSLQDNGVLLATFPGISQISRYDMDRWGDYWRFTDFSARRLFGDIFGEENITIETHGNVFVACSFLNGLATEELTSEELDFNDPDYQVLITVRAKKKNDL